MLLLGVQVLLGGLHVLLEIPPLTGLIHTATAMLLLGLLAWHLAARVAPRSGLRLGRRSWWPAAAAVATYLLLLSGSYVSRSGAALACPAFPACGAPAAVARGLVHTQMLHRFLALAVAIVAGAALATVWRKTAAGWVRGLVVGLALLLLVQGGLGVANVLLRLPIWSRVLHLATAAALWAGFVFLWGLPGAREGET